MALERGQQPAQPRHRAYLTVGEAHVGGALAVVPDNTARRHHLITILRPWQSCTLFATHTPVILLGQSTQRELSLPTFKLIMDYGLRYLLKVFKKVLFIKVYLNIFN